MVNSYVIITYELFAEIERKRGAVKKWFKTILKKLSEWSFFAVGLLLEITRNNKALMNEAQNICLRTQGFPNNVKG